jgi:hypothetical protein
LSEDKKIPATRIVVDINKNGIRRETTYPKKPKKARREYK